MESHSDIVLHDLSNYLGTNQAEDGRLEGTHNRPGQHEFSLPPADGGKDAWFFLAACFVVEALVWDINGSVRFSDQEFLLQISCNSITELDPAIGPSCLGETLFRFIFAEPTTTIGFPFSFGVFQEYYTTHEPISSDPGGVAVIGTTATGVMYTIGVLLFPAYKQWPKLATRLKWAGLPTMATALIAGSFANKVSHLVLSQGVLYAIGGSIIYYPTLAFLDEWFIQRKGLAYGIMWAGTGTAGLIIPFVMNFLLSTYGFRTTLRVWAVALILFSAPLIYFLRPRLPISPVSQPQRYGLGFLKTPAFWLFLMGVIIESLGYFIPSLYLPTFARSLGLSPSIGTLLVALVNASGVVSTVLGGLLVDRVHVTTVIALSTVGTMVAVFLFWGLSTALPLLCIFSILYGFFAGGFVSTIGGVVKVVKQRDERADVGTLLGLLSAGRGIGAVVSGPLSEALLNGNPWQGQTGSAYGSGFGSLIVFTGVTATVGGVSFLGKRLGWV